MKPEIISNTLFDAKSVAVIGLAAFLASFLAALFGLSATVAVYGAVSAFSLVALLVRREVFVLAVTRDGLRDSAFGFAAIAAALALQRWSDWCVGLCSLDSSAAVSNTTLVLALVIAPVAESIIVQGWIYDFFDFCFGSTWITVSTTALAFIAIHGFISIELVVAAVVLTLLRLRQRSLGPTILTHALTNGLVASIIVR